MAPSPVSQLELNVHMGTAPTDSPMIALMVIPPSTSNVVSNDITTMMKRRTYQLQSINFRLNPEGIGAVTTTSGTSTKAIEDGTDKPADPLPACGMKRSRDMAGDQPKGGLKHQKTDSTHRTPKASTVPQAGPSTIKGKAGPSTIKGKGKSIYIPDSQELVVLPLMPRSLYDELTTLSDDSDSFATEPETEAEAQRGGGLQIGRAHV